MKRTMDSPLKNRTCGVTVDYSVDLSLDYILDYMEPEDLEELVSRLAGDISDAQEMLRSAMFIYKRWTGYSLKPTRDEFVKAMGELYDYGL